MTWGATLCHIAAIVFSRWPDYGLLRVIASESIAKCLIRVLAFSEPKIIQAE